MNKKFNREMLNLQVEIKFCFFRYFISIFIFKYFVVFVSYSRVSTRFKSSTYTTIFANMVFDFLKMHVHIELFTYHSFNKYSLRQLYHMHSDCLIHIEIVVI